MPLERLERTPEVGDEVCSEVAAEPVAHEHPLDGDGLEFRGERVGRREPAMGAKPVGEVEEVEPALGAMVHAPRHRGDAAAPVGVVDDGEAGTPPMACMIRSAVS